MEIFIAIALLCGNPSQYRLGESEVLACQKYFTRCFKDEMKNVNKTLNATSEHPYVLTTCILKRKNWDGDK